jgi:uncharacterized protein (TIGR03437 family)
VKEGILDSSRVLSFSIRIANWQQRIAMRYRKSKFGFQPRVRLYRVLQTVFVILGISNLTLAPCYSEIGWFASQATAFSKNKIFAFKPLAATTSHMSAKATDSLSGRALYFEENRGQFASTAGYRTTYQGQQVLLTADGITWRTRSGTQPMPSLQMKLIGSNSKALSEGLHRLSGEVNYLLADRHYRHIPTYAKVQYHDVYPDIDLVYYFNQQKLEYDFVLSPGADIGRIRLAFDKAGKASLDKNGDLIIRTVSGELRHHKPIAYQIINGEKREIAARFRQAKNGRIHFEVAPYDSQYNLVIDPSLTYASYLGGNDYETGTDIAVDSAGNIYVAGTTNSLNFPVSSSAYQKELKGSDIFVTKFDPTGKMVLYSTFLGGTDTENATSIALDTTGNVYVTGSTDSSDFPTTVGVYKRTVNRGDVFVTKLNATGSDLIFSTLLGGGGNEVGYGIALDSTNNVYLTGSTTSSDFPATTGAFQGTIRGGSFEAFVTKFNPTGTQLLYSSFLGGNGNEEGLDIAVDTGGNAYLTGYTYSSNFPTTMGAYQTGFNGATNLSDAFIAKVNAAGNALTYSTYLGGKANDLATGIAIDAAGNAYVTGTTIGATNDFPTTTGAFQTSYKGSSIPGPVSDTFVTKLNPAGAALVYSTYLGGNGTDQAFGIAVNAQGSAFVTGSTSSSDFPTASDAFKIYAGAIDAFVAQLDVAGATVPFATYLGGGGNDSGTSVALDSLSNVYVAGNTASQNFPVFPNAYQASASAGQNAFFAAIKEGTNLLATTVTGASYRGVPMARESIVSVFGGRLGTRTLGASDADPNTPGIQLPTTLAGTTVKVKDRLGVERLAPLFFVSPTQVNYQVPPETSIGGALVTVTAEDGTVSIGTIQVVDVAPDVFSADSTGRGAAIGNAVRAKANGALSEEPIVRFANNKWELIPLDLGPDGEQMFLVFFGTGIRFRKDPQVSATIGGVTARVDYAKNQCCFVGLDQINLLIPRALIGRGEVDVVLTVDGQTTVPLKIAIK